MPERGDRPRSWPRKGRWPSPKISRQRKGFRRRPSSGRPCTINANRDSFSDVPVDAALSRAERHPIRRFPLTAADSMTSAVTSRHTSTLNLSPIARRSLLRPTWTCNSGGPAREHAAGSLQGTVPLWVARNLLPRSSPRRRLLAGRGALADEAEDVVSLEHAVDAGPGTRCRRGSSWPARTTSAGRFAEARIVFDPVLRFDNLPPGLASQSGVLRARSRATISKRKTPRLRDSSASTTWKWVSAVIITSTSDAGGVRAQRASILAKRSGALSYYVFQWLRAERRARLRRAPLRQQQSRTTIRT